MATTVGYTIRIGSATAEAPRRGGSLLLLALTVERDMGGSVGLCVLDFAAVSAGVPSLGETVSVDLDSGGGTVRVFTGAVDSVSAGSDRLRVVAHDGLARLAGLEVERVHKGERLGAVVKAILAAGGLRSGRVSDGPAFPTLTIRRRPPALGQLRGLARRFGADLHVDGGGKVHFTVPRAGLPDRRFTIGRTVRAVDLRIQPPLNDGIQLWGEGAAADGTAAKAYRLPAKLDAVGAAASLDGAGRMVAGRAGSRRLTVRDGAVRSGKAARETVKMRMEALASRAVRGGMEVTGVAGIELGDVIAVDGVPDDNAALRELLSGRRLRVRRLRHSLDRDRGFVTWLGF